MTDERQHTNPPTCTCQYLTVGNRLTTHNAVDSSRCEVHGPLSALRPPTPSGKPPLGPLDLARAHINGALEHIDDLTSPAIADLHCAIDYLDAHAEQPTANPTTKPTEEHRRRAAAFFEANGIAMDQPGVDELVTHDLALLLDEAFDLGVERGRMADGTLDEIRKILARIDKYDTDTTFGAVEDIERLLTPHPKTEEKT